MISGIMYFLLFLFASGSASASTDVDISGIHSLAGELLPNDSRFHAITGFDSSSFLYTQDGRGNSSTTYQATLEDSFESGWLVGSGDVQFYTFVNNNPSVGFESQQLYLSTKPGALGNSQITLGRKLYEWSKLDKTWTMMSLWSPRWTWDEIHPELIGMTGLFYSYNSSNFELLAFGSPLSIPERGTSVSEVNNQIVFSNPMDRALPSSVNVLNQQTPVNYSLVTPPLSSFLFRPNFALRARYHFDAGFWASANTGVLPVNMVQLAAEPYLDSGTGNIQVNIHPEFPMRNINTVETGFDAKAWDVWASLSYEQPFGFTNEANWLNPIITPSTIASIGTDVQITRNFSLNAAGIYIHEQPFTSQNQLAGIDVQLPSRFPLKRGAKVGGNFKFSDVSVANVSFTQDFQYASHLISVDLEHSFYTAKITIGGGADIFVSDTSDGYVGQYYGDDRLRGWLKYAF